MITNTLFFSLLLGIAACFPCEKEEETRQVWRVLRGIQKVKQLLKVGWNIFCKTPEQFFRLGRCSRTPLNPSPPPLRLVLSYWEEKEHLLRRKMDDCESGNEE